MRKKMLLLIMGISLVSLVPLSVFATTPLNNVKLNSLNSIVVPTLTPAPRINVIPNPPLVIPPVSTSPPLINIIPRPPLVIPITTPIQVIIPKEPSLSTVKLVPATSPLDHWMIQMPVFALANFPDKLLTTEKGYIAVFDDAMNTNDYGQYNGKFTQLMASTDLLNWQPKNIDVKMGSLDRVAYANGIYLGNFSYSYGMDKLTYTSKDGLNWTESPKIIGNFAAGKNIFVTPSGNSILWSKDGENWTKAQINSAPKDAIRDIFFVNNQFVAKGSIFETPKDWDITFVSTDGKTWKKLPQKRVLENVSFRELAYGNGCYVGVSYASTNILTSKDLINWTKVENPQIAYNRDLYFYQNQFVIVSGTSVLKSTNGLDWSKACTFDGALADHLVLHNGTFLCAIHNANPEWSKMMTSNDLSTWRDLHLQDSSDYTAIAFNKDLGIAVGSPGLSAISSQGKPWISGLTNKNEHLSDIVYQNNMFVAVGDKGTILTTVNGSKWEVANSGTSNDLLGVAYLQDRFVAWGKKGVILTSLNGTQWELLSSKSQENVLKVTYGNGNFVVLNENGVMQVSNNLSNFVRVPLAKLNPIDISYGNGWFVLLDKDGRLATSPDGKAWTENLNYYQIKATHLDFAISGPENGAFIMTGDDKTAGFSTNGTNWTFANKLDLPVINKVVFANDSVYILGGDHIIYKSGKIFDWNKLLNN